MGTLLPACLEIGSVRVELEDIGEGWSGDYTDDPDDAPLMRFSVLRREKDEWMQVPDSSYCTRVDIRTLEPTRVSAILHKIMDEVFDIVAAGHRPKHVCEQLSWME